MNNEIIEAEVVGLPVEYTVTAAVLEALKAQYSVVPDCSTKKGYKETKAALSVLRPIRTGLEKERKKLKADALEYGRRVDSVAKEIKETIEGIEKPFLDAKAAEDEKIEAAKKLDDERKAKILSKIEAIKAAPMKLPRNAERIQQAIDNLKAINFEAFQEFTDDAIKVCGDVHDELTVILKEIKEADAAAAQVSEERAKLEAERKAFEEEKKKFQKEHAVETVPEIEVVETVEEVMDKETMEVEIRPKEDAQENHAAHNIAYMAFMAQGIDPKTSARVVDLIERGTIAGITADWV